MSNLRSMGGLSGRPCKERTSEGYRNMIQHLSRLRVSVVTSTALTPELIHKACANIDALIDTLLELARTVE